MRTPIAMLSNVVKPASKKHGRTSQPSLKSARWSFDKPKGVQKETPLLQSL
jgi:hypothetical protein